MTKFQMMVPLTSHYVTKKSEPLACNVTRLPNFENLDIITCDKVSDDGATDIPQCNK